MTEPTVSDDQFEHILRQTKDNVRAKAAEALIDRVFEEASAMGPSTGQPVVRFFDPRPARRDR